MPHFLPRAVVVLAALAALPVASLRAEETPPAAHAAEASDRLRLSDRETMAGDFLGFTAGKGAQFRHPACDGVLTVKADHLDTLFLRPTPAATAPAADWCVALNNGDSLAGKLVSYSPDKLILETSFAGRLEIATAAVASLTPLAAPNTPGSLFGVGKAEDWQAPPAAQAFALVLGAGGQVKAQAPAAPTVKEGSLLVPSGGAMRTLDMQAQSRLDLTLEGSPAFTVEFASEAEANGKETAHAFHVYPGHVSMSKVVREPGSMRSESNDMFRRTAAKAGPVALSFLTDAKGGRITVVADGVKIGSAAFPVATVGKRLVLRGRGGDLRLTRLALTPGVTTLEEGAQARPATDTAALANGDKAAGTLLAIADGKTSFKTEAGTLDLPVARLRGITLSAAHNLAQAADKDAVRVHFGDGCRLTLESAQIKDGVLSGSAAGLGNVALKLGGAEKVVFNPDAQMPSREAQADAGRSNAGQEPGDVFQGGFIQGGVGVQVFGAGAAQAVPNIQLRQIAPEDLRGLREQMQKRAVRGLRELDEKKEEEKGKEDDAKKKDDAPAPGQSL